MLGLATQSLADAKTLELEVELWESELWIAVDQGAPTTSVFVVVTGSGKTVVAVYPV
ncbi:hypothetical protein [Yoonia sp.]|uniref:hypothetical protein n=1 Tax=Yoonia sp. TaxID=2212373 RepID=UPI0025D8412D|nr:hypothetical protein [Yoonia sp.]